MKRSLDRARAGAVALLLLPLRVYQRLISPALPRRCKYHPTCSAYAAEALRELGPLRGTIVAAWRLARCNPFSDGGYDPLEARALFRPAESPSSDSRNAAA
ncbi:MAG TPA: membrane protein insertion efficiency factor YidD [Solirubrobacterales bacterium]|nr:membrane protein insertion efficiency factor YidD [Solirubrobacterales bacterium]